MQHLPAQGWPAQQGQPYAAVYPPGPAQHPAPYPPSSNANAVASTSASAPLHPGPPLHNDHHAGQYHHQPPHAQSYYAPAPASGQPVAAAQVGAPSSAGGGAGGGGGPGGAGGGYGLVQPGAQGAYAQGMAQGPQNGYPHPVQHPPPPPPSRSPYPSAAPPPPPLQHRPPSRPPSIALMPQPLQQQQQQQQQMLHAQPAAAYGNSFVQPALHALPASSPALMSPTAHRFNSNPSTGPPPVAHQGYPPPQPRPSPAPPPPPPQPQPSYAAAAPLPQQAPVPTAAGLDAHLARLDEAAQLQHNAAQLEAVLKRGAYPGGGPRAGQPLTPDQHAQMDAQVRDLRNREMSVLTTCDSFVRAHGGSQLVNRFIDQYRASVQRQQHQQQQQQHVQQQQHLQQQHQMQHAAAAAAAAAAAQPRRAATMQMPPQHAQQGYPGGPAAPVDQLPPPRPASATPHSNLQHQAPVQRERTHTYPQQHQQPGPPHLPPPPHPHPHPQQPSQTYTTLAPSQPGLVSLQPQQGNPSHYQHAPPPPLHQQQQRQGPPPGPVRRMPSASAIAQQYAVQAQRQAQQQAQQQGQALAHDGYSSPHPPPPRQPPTPVAGGPSQRPHPHAPNGGDPNGVSGVGGGGAGGGGGPPPQQRDSAASGMHAHVTAAAVASSRDQAQRQLAAGGRGQQQQQMGGTQGLGQGQRQGQPGFDGRGAWEEAQRREREEHERRERARDLQVEQQQQQQAGKARLGIKHPTQALAEGQPGWPSLADLQAQVTSQFFWDTLAQVLEKRGQRLNPQGFVLENRLVDLFRLSQVVIGQFGGYVRSDFDKSWMHIASQFGFSPSSPAPGQLRDLYMRIVGPYEDAWASHELKKLRLGGPPPQPMHLANGMGHAPPPPSMQPPAQREQGAGSFAQPPSVTSSPAQHLPFVPSASGAGLVNASTPTPTPPTSLALPPQPTYALPQHSSAPEQSLSSIFANSFAAFPLTPSTGPSAAPALASARSPEPTVQQLIAQAKELQREHLADRAAAENSPTKGSPRKLAGLPAPTDHDVRRSPQLQVATAASTLSPQTSSTPREQVLPEPMQPPTPRSAVLNAASAAGQVAPFSSAPPGLLRRTPSDAPYLSPAGGGSPPLSRTGSSSRKRERTHEPNELGQVADDAGRRKREGTGTFAEPTAAASSSKAQHLVVPVVGASPASIETPDLVASRALRPDSATSASTSTSASPRSSRGLSISTGSVMAPVTPGPSSAAPQPLAEVATPVQAALAASASALSLGTPTSASAVAASASTTSSLEAPTTDPLAGLSLTAPVEASPMLFGGSGWGGDSAHGALGSFDFTSDASDLFGTAAAAAAGKTLALDSTLDDDSWAPSSLADFSFAADWSSHS